MYGDKDMAAMDANLLRSPVRHTSVDIAAVDENAVLGNQLGIEGKEVLSCLLILHALVVGLDVESLYVQTDAREFKCLSK